MVAVLYPGFRKSEPTAAGRSMVTAADAAAQRTLLGLGTADSPTFAGLNVPLISPTGHVLEQRSGTTGQKNRIFGSYTTDTDKFWLELDASGAGGAFYDFAACVGSLGGTARGMRLGSKNAAGAFTSWLSFSTAGAATFVGTISGTSLTATGLTSGRIPFVTSGGLLADSSAFSYNGVNTFVANGLRIIGGSALNTIYQSNSLVDLSITTAGGRVVLGSAASAEHLIISALGKVGVRVTAPTAYLHLVAGTATANTAPLKLTAGTNLTTPENGAFEYDGTNLFFTTGGVRKTIQVA